MRPIDADVFKAYLRGALEQTRRCYPDGGEWAEAVTEEFCRDIDEQPTAQPEIIRCKDCKYMIDTGDDLICDNAKGWVVATTSDFGCVLAERRTE